MGKIIAAAVALVAALFLAGLLVPVVSVEAAEPPVWKEGDRWALGWDESVSMKNNATVNALLAGLISSGTGMDVESAKAEISAGAAIYVLFKVTDVTDDTYVVSTKLAIKLEADLKAEATGQVPKAGTYQISGSSEYDLLDGPDFSSIPDEDWEEKTVKVSLGADFAFVLEGTTVFNRTTLAVNSVDISAKAAAIVSVDGTNVPNIDEDEGNITIAYEDFDIDLKVVLSLDASIAFAPEPLNLFNLPLLADGEEWSVDTNATVSGEIGGFIDAKGLPEDIEESIFGIELLKNANITKFPIDFVDLIPESSELSDGQFGPYTQNISASFSAVEVDAGVFAITMQPGFEEESSYTDYPTDVAYEESWSLLGGIGLTYTYDSEPDEKQFICGLGLSAGFDDLPVNPSAFIPFLEPVDADDAADEIASIASYQKDVEKRASSDNVTDFFFDAPYIGLILVVVAAVVLGTALFMVTRARKQ